jgi:calcium/calmodulin-dependent protein kinase I
MVLELLDGGELFDRIVEKGSSSEKEAAKVVHTIAIALEYLHGTGITHRDLKPANLIYQDKNPNALLKVTDFGLAKYRDCESKDLFQTPCGTPGYVAPEVLCGDNYDHTVDIWSLGVILYILLCGFPPFYAEKTSDLYAQIKAGEFDFPDPH